MADNKTVDHIATPADDADGLRGGTQGGRSAPLVTPNSTPSEATVGSGAPRVEGEPLRAAAGGSTHRGSRTDDRDDPARVHEEGTRRPSAGASNATARAEADVPEGVSRSGYNEGDPRQIGPDRKDATKPPSPAASHPSSRE
jgi:hypothetical protein